MFRCHFLREKKKQKQKQTNRTMDAQFVDILVNVIVTPPSVPDFGEQEDITIFY